MCSIFVQVKGVQWENLQEVFKSWPQPVILLDTSWHIKAVSEVYVKHIRPPLQESDVLGMSFLDLCLQRVQRLDQIQSALEEVKCTQKSGVCFVQGASTSTFHIEIDPLFQSAADDARVMFGVRVAIISASRFNLVGANIVGSRQKVHDAEIWISLIDSLTAHSIFLTDTDKRIITWGKGAQQLFGYTDLEAEGQRFPEIVSGNAAADDSFAKHAPEGVEGEKYEMTMTCRDGHQMVAETRVFLVHSQQGMPLGYGHIVRDLTGQRRIENAVIDAGRTAVHVQANIISKVSHEYGNLLAVIINAAELIQNPADEDEVTRSRQLANEITQAARQLRQIFMGMLDCTQFMEKGVSLQPESVRIADLVQDTAAKWPCPVSLDFNTIVDQQLPELLRSDQSRLQQMLGHLLTNSYKFTPPGGQVFQQVYLYSSGCAINSPLISNSHPALQIIDDPHTPIWVLAIEDTGIGIAESSIQHLGQLFYQGPATGYYEGVGTGLYLTRIIAETMGGKLYIFSKQGEGTRVEIHLPLVQVEVTTPGNEVEMDPSQALPSSRRSSNLSLEMHQVGSARTVLPEWAKHCRVLLVEDNLIIQKTTRRILNGLQVATCDVVASGEEAVTMALQEPRYHLIFMDLHLAGKMHGIEAARQISAQDKKVRIVTLSSQNSDLDRSLCAEAGMQDYLVKPASRVELYRMVLRCLSQTLSPITSHTRRTSLEKALAAYTIQ